MIFFIIFVLIPLSEIIVFITVSQHIGLGFALLTALMTAILGGFLVRHQGIQTIMSAQSSLRSGGIPSNELFDGLCIVAAGAMLITPGFITDILGFSLLVPAIRFMIRRKLEKSGKFQMGSSHMGYQHTEDSGHHSERYDSGVIDVEYETVSEDDKP